MFLPPLKNKFANLNEELTLNAIPTCKVLSK
jgi:hypothetical protein